MFFLEVLSRVVSIFAGIVGGLNGLVSLVQKCKPYIKRDKAETEKMVLAQPKIAEILAGKEVKKVVVVPNKLVNVVVG